MRRSKAINLVLPATLAILCGWGVLWGLWQFWLADLIAAVANGSRDFAGLGGIIASRRAADPRWVADEHVLWVARTVLSRIGVAWTGLVLAVVLIIRRRAVAGGLASYFSEPDSALNLAVLRIATFGALLVIPAGREEFLIHTRLPDTLLFPPSGLGPILAATIPDESTARLILLAWILTTGMAAAGLFTRPAAVLSTLLTLVVLGIPQLHGKVNHGHHLVWFAILLATSPCGDVLSVDAWVKRRRTAPAPDTRYGLPLRFAWLLLGVVYFFPGAWKLWTGGVDWIFSDHLQHQIWHQWTTHATWEPLIDPTGHPWLLRLGGLGVVTFELTFFLLMFHRRTRIVALFLGLGFHLANQLTLNIGFISLQLVYVSLIDWPRVLAAIGVRSRSLGIGRADGPRPTGSLAPTLLAGVVLLTGNVWYGVAGENYGWPFACYPKFGFPIREPVRSIIEVEIATPDGERVRQSFATGQGPVRTARWIGMVSRVLKLPPGDRRDAGLQALAELAIGDRPAGTTLHFTRAEYSTRPSDRGDEALRRETLASVTIADPGPHHRQP